MLVCKPATSQADFDFLDPRSWVDDTHEHRIYLTPDLELYAVVDAVDYPAAVAYTWSSLGTKWKRTHKPKHYARRSVHELLAPEGEKFIHPITGKLTRNRHRTVRSVFLHHFIAERAGLICPGDGYRLDHRNGDSLNCRRRNLRWVTFAFNTRNVHGSLADADEGDPSV
jgi:hypothetical protein